MLVSYYWNAASYLNVKRSRICSFLEQISWDSSAVPLAARRLIDATVSVTPERRDAILPLTTKTQHYDYVDQQTLKPDDDYVLPHGVRRSTRLSTVGERAFPVVYGAVFHRTSLLPPCSPSSALVLNHISSHFLIPPSDSSLICTVPVRWLVNLDTINAFTFNILTF